MDEIPLPAPGGGTWMPVDGIDGSGNAKQGLVEREAREEISKWERHWFPASGSRDLYWGPGGPSLQDDQR